MNAITYRIMESMEDLIAAEELQCVVWGMTKEHTLSAGTMRWMVHIGGLLLGAWDGNRLIGFSIGSPGKREGKWILWSDMTGTHPDYQSQGIGYQLKLKQKEWVREQGYEEIRWTFDPMRRGNAFFNFCKLGVISTSYHPAFYGEMKDSINTNLYTDRLEAVWSIIEDTPPTPQLLTDAPFAVSFDGKILQAQSIEASQLRIQIPYDLDQLKNNDLAIALKWQQAVRETFIKYFRMGYTCIGFAKNTSQCWYIVHKG